MRQLCQSCTLCGLYSALLVGWNLDVSGGDASQTKHIEVRHEHQLVVYDTEEQKEHRLVTRGTQVDHCVPNSPVLSLNEPTLRAAFVGADAGKRQVYIANIDLMEDRINGVIELGLGEDPSWSPAGGRLAFTSTDGAKGVVVVGADGMDRKVLDPFGKAPRWCGKSGCDYHIAYLYASDIRVVNFVEGTDKFLSGSNSLGGLSTLDKILGWDTTGTTVYFAGSDGKGDVIDAVSVSTGKAAELMEVEAELFRQLSGSRDLSWSPDGTRIVFSKKVCDVFRLYLYDKAGSCREAQPLTGQCEGWSNSDVSWSGDGRYIVYVSGRRDVSP